MRFFKTLVAILALAVAPAMADSTTSRLGLTIPATGSYNWAQKADNNFYALDTGTFFLNGQNTMTVGPSGSSVTIQAGIPWLFQSSSITLTGQNGTISAAGGVSGSSAAFTNGVTASSFTATAVPGFKGDISNGTGLPLTTGVTGQLPIANGGTAGTTAATARSNLSAAQSGANNDITSESGAGAAVNFPNGVSGSSGSFTNGVTASSFTTTATGAAQFAISLSTSITFPQSGGTGMGIRWPDGTISTTAVVATAGGAGHTVTTGTVSGGTVVAGSSVPFTARKNLAFDTAGFAVFDDQASSSTVVQVKNLTFMASSTTYVPNGTAFASGSSFAGCQSTVTVITGNNRLWVFGSGSFNANALNNTAGVWALVDGGFTPGHTSAMTGSNVTNNDTTSNSQQGGSFSVVTGVLSAGSHTVCIGGAGGSGSATYWNVYDFGAVEMATGGQGYAAQASSVSANLAGLTQTNVNFGVAIATVQVTASGAPMMLCYNGPMTCAETNGGPQWSILDNGAFIGGTSATVGMEAGGQASSSGWEESSMSGCYPYTPTAGLHSFALTTRCTSGSGATIRIGQSGTPTTLTDSRLWVYENRVTAGGGDMSSNGLNSVTGQNKFSAPNNYWFSDYFVAVDSKTAGTGGTAHNASSFAQVTLNTMLTNTDGIPSLASNQVTIPAGTWTCEFWDCFMNTTDCRTILWDATNSNTLGLSDGNCSNVASQKNFTHGMTRFTNVGQIAIEVRSRAGNTQACSYANWSVGEIYAQLKCTREK